MKYPVLPLHQPWASLCVNINPETGKAWKQIETRSKPCPKTILGKTVLIHANKGWSMNQAEIYHSKPDKLMPFGAIIGCVDIIECGYMAMITPTSVSINWAFNDITRGVDTSGVCSQDMEWAFGLYSEGRYAWKLANPVKFAEPIPFKANQGISYIELEKLPI